MVLEGRHRRVYDLLPSDGSSMRESDWASEALRMRVSPDRDSFWSSVAVLYYDRRVVSRRPIPLEDNRSLLAFAYFYKRA